MGNFRQLYAMIKSYEASKLKKNGSNFVCEKVTFLQIQSHIFIIEFSLTRFKTSNQKRMTPPDFHREGGEDICPKSSILDPPLSLAGVPAASLQV